MLRIMRAGVKGNQKIRPISGIFNCMGHLGWKDEPIDFLIGNLDVAQFPVLPDSNQSRPRHSDCFSSLQVAVVAANNSGPADDDMGVALRCDPFGRQRFKDHPPCIGVHLQTIYLYRHNLSSVL